VRPFNRAEVTRCAPSVTRGIAAEVPVTGRTLAVTDAVPIVARVLEICAVADRRIVE
jgi:hypothetical protein